MLKKTSSKSGKTFHFKLIATGLLKHNKQVQVQVQNIQHSSKHDPALTYLNHVAGIKFKMRIKFK